METLGLLHILFGMLNYVYYIFWFLGNDTSICECCGIIITNQFQTLHIWRSACVLIQKFLAYSRNNKLQQNVENAALSNCWSRTIKHSQISMWKLIFSLAQAHEHGSQLINRFLIIFWKKSDAHKFLLSFEMISNRQVIHYNSDIAAIIF